jgi:hypothetical protein
MNRETVETAAFGYVKDKYIPLDKAYGSKEEMGSVKAGFIAGAKWQEQQEANDAIEFADWLFENTYELRWKNNSKRYLSKDANAYSSQQLYEIWQQSKNK